MTTYSSSKILNIKKVTYYIIFVLLLYLFLFDPPFFMFRGPLRFSNILLCLSFVYNVIHWSSVKKILISKKSELMMFSVLFAFIALRCLLQSEVAFINKTMMSFLNIFLVVPFLMHFAQRNGFGTEEQIVRAIMITGVVATLITIVCLSNESIQEYVKFNILQIQEDEYLFKNDYRGFGLATRLTSNYGFVLGFISGMGCFYVKDNRWFTYCIPFLIIAGLVNSRTSAIIAFSVITIYLFSFRQKGYAFLVGGVAILFFGFFDNIMQLLNVDTRTFEWIMSFQEQISDVAESGSIYASSATSKLFGTMVVWPETVEQWLLGRGYDLFVEKNYLHSDNGWIRQLNFGGIFYLVLFYIILFRLLRRLVKCHNVSYMLVFLFVFSIVNTKTMSYPGDTLFPLMMFFYFFKTNDTFFRYANQTNYYSTSLF